MSCRTFIVSVLAALAAIVLRPVASEAQLPKDPVERAKVIAQIFEANARQLTLFDCTGNEVARVGARDLYHQPGMSPDKTRIAVIKPVQEEETNGQLVYGDA